MSNKSGVSSNVISLPNGGGSLHGIGEKFAPDMHTGTGNFSIPITLPGGRNSFQPQLKLVYSTGNGNGAFGLGWNLSIPGVSRKTSKGVPKYDDPQDTFILSGAEDLIAVPGGLSHTTQYRPRTESLFARILHHRDEQDNYWEVRTKDGLVSLYGTPPLGAAVPAWRDPAAITNPNYPNQIFAWKLTTTTDPFGNRNDYLYDRDVIQTDGPHHWDQIYLSEIRYADFGDRDHPQYLITVKFSYEDRPDPFSEYRAGFEIRTIRRCTKIEIFTHPNTDILTRSFHLVYLDQKSQPVQRLPVNGVSLLSEIRIEGHDGTQSEWLPPLEFDYTRFEPQKRDFFPITGPDLPPGSLAQPDYELVDVFGNGLPDIIEISDTVRYWRNRGKGQFDVPREMPNAPAGLRLADPGIQMFDTNGDGRIELVANTDTLSGYYSLRFGGLWDRRSFRPYVGPSFNLEDPEVKLVDLDGDGVTDAIHAGTRLEYFFNNPATGWDRVVPVERRASNEFPNVNFSDARVKWADMTGDGLQDILLVYDGNVEYWPNLGHGHWGKRISMSNSPRFPYNYDPKRILVGDIDGDGAADIVYVDDTQITLWINTSGNGWSEPVEIQGTPPVSDIDGVRLVDLLGVGVSGVLWSMDAGGLSRQRMFFLDLTGGIKPYLLNQMDNHMGSITRVGYRSSTRFYLEHEKCPDCRWKTQLPFPVQVVDRVEVIDAISGGKLTTEYDYYHGYWDGGEREFRGFGRVHQRDTEVFEDFNAAGLAGEKQAFESIQRFKFSPPTETRTWFHQGPVGDEFGEWEELDYSSEFWQGDDQFLSRPVAITDFLRRLPRRAKRDALRTLRGRVIRTEIYALDDSERQDRPYTITESLHGVLPIPIGVTFPDEPEPWQLEVFFPCTLAQRTTQWERGGDPMTRLEFTSDFDVYGQPRSRTNIAVPHARRFRESAAPGEPYLATQSLTAYADRDDEQKYIVDRVARTTSYEILNDGSPPLLEFYQAIQDSTAPRRVVEQQLTFYDGNEFQGLPFGELGEYGAAVRIETLILTDEILHEAYKSGNAVLALPEIPPYLAPGIPPAWTPDYPQAFRNAIPALADYVYQPGGAGSPYERGYFVITEQRRYDFHIDPAGLGRGLINIKRDARGNDTQIEYDNYDLLPVQVVQVTDSVGLITEANYDYRLLQPREMTNPNGNRIAYTYTPLGLLESTAEMGKIGEARGDTLAVPGMQLVYDLTAFSARSQPISVRTIRRVHHVNDTDIPLPTRDETVETIEYSDGYGRLLQKRTLAEDTIFGDLNFGDAGLPADQSLPIGEATGRRRSNNDPVNVVVTGWQIYDNKGRVVEKYEPFFSTGWDYASPLDTQRGQKATMFYDPRGHVSRTVNPDNSEQRVVYGIPGSLAVPDLSNPESFEPTPWVAFTYDSNDNAGRTHPGTTNSYQGHRNTPTSAVVDALGRTVEITERNGPNPATDWYTTRSSYDIRGNLTTVTDALGRLAFRYIYDLGNRPLRVEQLDAGVRRLILDAVGNVIEQRDSKGALILRVYDRLNRTTRLWARDGVGQAVTLREHVIYGDSLDANLTQAQAKAVNLLSKPYKHYDEAGLVIIEAHDFKGNILEKVRRVISDAQLVSVFNPPPANWQVRAFRVNWQPPGGTTLNAYANTLLDPAEYRTTFSYDALNRVKHMDYPSDVLAARKQLRPEYNRAGALEKVLLDGATYVEHIAYNAKGQRAFIAYGNGVMTRHCYHPQTFRLVRLRTERFANPNLLTYRPSGAPLQDFAYDYDLAGNMLALHDRTPDSGLPAQPNQLDRNFTYDPLYRLESATGRECDGQPPPAPWDDTFRCADLRRTRPYKQTYRYDSVGNMTRLEHQANGGSFTRVFALLANSNRLTTMTIGPTIHNYTYDANGNLTDEGTARHFEWDHNDRMRVYRTQTANAEPTVHTQYLYDASGERVKKLVRKQGRQVEVTVYIDGLFEYHRIVQGGATQENNSLHIMDGKKRIALIRIGNAFPGDNTPAVKYHLGDHLSSSNIVINNAGGLMNREEFTPFGETSFGSFALKRYRFTGKERDAESSLYYHGARYYAPWLGRWMSCDPEFRLQTAESVRVFFSYAYSSNNPLRYKDPNGKWVESAWDAISLGIGVVSFVDNVREGNVGAAVLDGVGIVADTAALILPLVPGGVGAAIKTVRAGERAVETVQTARRVEHAADAAQAVRRTEQAAETAQATRRAEQSTDASRAVPPRATSSSAPSTSATPPPRSTSSGGSPPGSGGTPPGGSGGPSYTPNPNIRPHGQQPSPRPPGTQSHHPEQQSALSRNIGNYDPNQDPALLMSTPQHRATFGPQTQQRARPDFEQQLGTPSALEEASNIMQRTGVPESTAGQVTLEHSGYLFSTTPANQVQSILQSGGY